MGTQRDKDGGAKIRTPKRQRKDSTTEKDKEEQKKFKMDDTDKLINIEETAIDGIELMANYKVLQEDEEKPSTEDEKEREVIEDEPVYLPDRDKEISERDKEMSERDKDMSEREKDSFSEMEDDEKYNKSDTDNESDGKDKTTKNTKFKNLKVKFRIRPKKRGGSIYTLVMDKDAEEPKVEEPPQEPPKVEEEAKPDIDVDLAMRQIRKGWSIHDAGDLTIGDLYLMFGSRSKLELDYWWAEPTPPLPQPQKSATPPTATSDKRDKYDKGADSSVEDEKERARESDNDILSPKNTYSQDSNDGMSGDERKCEQLASPEHKTSSNSGTLKLVSKLINRPQAPPPHTGFSMMTDRLKRLLALAGNPHAGAAPPAGRCGCGHVCAHHRKQQVQALHQKPQYASAAARPDDASAVFRHPTPIAPRPDSEVKKREMHLEGLPRWRRGRPRLPDRRVVVQRLLPLLPKLPHNAGLTSVPMKSVPTSPPPPPRILPKPPLTASTDSSSVSIVYVLSESNGQFYFHDGDRRIPINQAPLYPPRLKEESTDESKANGNVVKSECAGGDVTKREPLSERDDNRTDAHLPPEFLSSESMSLSPSRLLHDADGWLDGAVHDFSLSSFLGHLEGRPQVDSHLQSLMAESSVDYVAKFADLAAEVTDEQDHPPDEQA